jgi:hypothetical protein
VYTPDARELAQVFLLEGCTNSSELDIMKLEGRTKGRKMSANRVGQEIESLVASGMDPDLAVKTAIKAACRRWHR